MWLEVQFPARGGNDLRAHHLIHVILGRNRKAAGDAVDVSTDDHGLHGASRTEAVHPDHATTVVPLDAVEELAERRALQ